MAESQQPSSASTVESNSAGEDVCALIVTFNPEPSLYERVQSLRAQVREVLIIDNASAVEHTPLLQRLESLPGVQVIRNSANLGIGAALNLGSRLAIQRGYRWIATFDQDSRVGPGFIAGMLRSRANHALRQNIALIAPHYREEASGFLHQARTTAESGIITTTMMSGNLVETDALRSVGFYNEDFFIDYVDHEFCLRLALYGFLVLRSPEVLEHNLGRISRVRVAGRLLVTTNHSPLRRYYNARNRVLVYRAYYRSAPKWAAQDLKTFVIETVKIALFEQERRAKLGSIVRGVWDGLRRRGTPSAGNLRDPGLSLPPACKARPERS
jgi:rhamnosyltransferase